MLEGVQELPFDVFQLDDGWQISLGNWEASSRFPSGMADLAGRIHKAGFTPGIWLAPFIVQPGSQLFKEHRDWLLHDSLGKLVPAGHNWGDFFYALDTTHPQAQAWLEGLFRRVCSWGYDYLKIDFLYAAALPGIRYKNMLPEMAYREGLQVVRKAAGDAYLLVCGSPVLASLGVADGMRIGPDVAPEWDNHERSFTLHDFSGPSTLNAIRTSVNRLWLNPLIDTDPDVAFFRTRYNLLLPEQKKYLKDLAYIAGFRATSDLPVLLDANERLELKTFLETQPRVERLGRYQFRLDGRMVDYSFIELPDLLNWPPVSVV